MLADSEATSEVAIAWLVGVALTDVVWESSEEYSDFSITACVFPASSDVYSVLSLLYIEVTAWDSAVAVASWDLS